MKHCAIPTVTFQHVEGVSASAYFSSFQQKCYHPDILFLTKLIIVFHMFSNDHSLIIATVEQRYEK